MHPTTRWIPAALFGVAAALLICAAAPAERIGPEDRERLIEAQRFRIDALRAKARADSLLRAVVGPDSSAPAGLFALELIGKYRFSDRDYRGAIDALQRRERLSPGSAEALYYIGLAHKELGEPEQALDALRRAASLDPGNADRQLWLGLLLHQQDSPREAEAAFERSTRADSTSLTAAIAFRMRGNLAFQDGRYEDAARAFEHAVRIDDSDEFSWMRLDAAYRKLGLDAAERAARIPVRHFIDAPLPPLPDSIVRGAGGFRR